MRYKSNRKGPPVMETRDNQLPRSDWMNIIQWAICLVISTAVQLGSFCHVNAYYGVFEKSEVGWGGAFLGVLPIVFTHLVLMGVFSVPEELSHWISIPLSCFWVGAALLGLWRVASSTLRRPKAD